MSCCTGEFLVAIYLGHPVPQLPFVKWKQCIENFVMIESKETNGWSQAYNLLLVCRSYHVLFLMEAWIGRNDGKGREEEKEKNHVILLNFEMHGCLFFRNSIKIIYG